MQEPRRLLRLARRPVALDEGLPPRLVQPPDLPGHARIEPGANRVVDAPAREMADDPRPAARRVDVQGRRLAVMRRDRQLPVGQRQGVECAPLREADLSFVAEILQDWMSIKPCSDRIRPAGEMSFC